MFPTYKHWWQFVGAVVGILITIVIIEITRPFEAIAKKFRKPEWVTPRGYYAPKAEDLDADR